MQVILSLTVGQNYPGVFRNVSRFGGRWDGGSRGRGHLYTYA